MIKVANKCYDDGYYIKIFTSRGMGHFKAKENEVIVEIGTWLGKEKVVGGYLKNDVYKTIKKTKKKNLKVIAEYNGPIEAPVKKDQKIGIIRIFYKENFLSEHDIYASTDIKKVNLLSRLIQSINYLIWGDV